MTVSNDTRGWILTSISAIACCFGASIICVDVIARQFRQLRGFEIAKSDVFLSASFSLSAGVILYSALVSMLPSSKTYLKKGGYSPKAASFLFIGLFLLGVFGIRILSRIMHKFMPSHVVDCDHTHDEDHNEDNSEQTDDKPCTEEMTEGRPDEVNGYAHSHANTADTTNDQNTETTPLLSRSSMPGHLLRAATAPAPDSPVNRNSQTNANVNTSNSRPSNIKRTISSLISSGECDENGPCRGFSDLCGQDCFRIAQRRSTVAPSHIHASSHTTRPHLPQEPQDSNSGPEQQSRATVNRTRTSPPHSHHVDHEQHENQRSPSHHLPNHSHNHGEATDHHHHVPTNAFTSISLQTSIAIAIHKAPEGFITYATNHANPTLGFSVFIALFIHNITEGFVLALPLFLATKSRVKAISLSFIFGGLSQPLGAGVAALWFKLAERNHQFAPDEKVYGGIFAVTSGIMASVALSLLTESLQLSHNREMCIWFAFVGMALLGVSQALNAG